jgi:Protein of unknown function (DUF3822)
LFIIAGLKEIFHIQNKSTSVQSVLLLQAGQDHIAFAITDKSGTELYELAYCTAGEWNTVELSELLNTYTSLREQHYDIQVAFDTSRNVLIPSSTYKAGDAEVLLTNLYGINNGYRIVSELIPEWQVYNIYAAENTLWEWVNIIFPFAKYRHQYSLTVKKAEAAEGNGCILADFRTNDFSVMATADGKILLAQNFEYSTPEDVVYYLLKTCQQYTLSQSNVSLKLSGLIDKQSALYKELYQYFINIEFSEAGWNMAGTEYPAHFFTSLNDLAQCVS